MIFKEFILNKGQRFTFLQCESVICCDVPLPPFQIVTANDKFTIHRKSDESDLSATAWRSLHPHY